MPGSRRSKVAFIVVGWNNRGLLADCFESINEQTYTDHRIIYVDNASSDGTVSRVRKRYPEVTVLNQTRNTGFAKGNNIGIKEALSDPAVGYVALVNSDARLNPGWLEKIINFAELKPNGACFQGMTLDYYNRNIIDSTHIFVARNGQGTQGNWRYYRISELGPRKVFGVNAAACVITRNFIEAQPFGSTLFDESLFMYLEDIDLACRATVLGWDNYLVRDAHAFHMGSASSGRNPGYSLYMTFRNNSAVLFKNFPLGLIFRMLPKIIRGDIDTVRTLWRRRQKRAILKMLRGRLVGLLRLPLYLLKQQVLRARRKVDQNYLWGLMNQGY